ncbi:MAG TPA: 1-acyl-sn-glycerol-3-phosphate acyltransferase [Candidatus Brocadiales bacterium]|nr:1-acyl-sn-glycerol-3-phosphate acyltransferase [Candidatus Brocadiales bacterium]
MGDIFPIKMLTRLISSKPFQILYFAYSWVLVCTVWFVGYLLAMLVSIGSRRRGEIYNSFCRASAWVIVKGLGIRVRVEGREGVPKGEPFIFICNHQSLLDIKLAFAFVPGNFCFISKEEITRIPIVGSYMKTAGHIGMPREEDRRAYVVLLEIIKKAKEGKSLLIFPEGTRSPDGKLGPFKRGVANIILKAGRRVVPTAIIGSREFLPRESWLCHPEHRDITIRFGRPIGFHHLDKVPREESLIVLEELRQEVKKLLGEEVGAIHELPLQSDDKKAVVPQVRPGESASGMTSREEARG